MTSFTYLPFIHVTSIYRVPVTCLALLQQLRENQCGCRMVKTEPKSFPMPWGALCQQITTETPEQEPNLIEGTDFRNLTILGKG